MNTRSAARSWLNRSGWSAVALCFLLQVGLIWWFSPRTPVRGVPATASPRITMQLNAPESTSGPVSPLFLSHVTKEGFSGAIWLEPTLMPQPVLDWTNAPPVWLKLDPNELGTSFSGLLNRLVPAITLRPGLPEPEFSPPPSLTPPPLIRQPSRLRVEGDLGSRAPPELPPLDDQASETLLQPTVLEVGVDVSGNVISMIPAMRSDFILGSPGRAAPTLAVSGRPETDQYAARIAMALRFQPIPKAVPSAVPGQITQGRLVFEWRTIPPVSTNAPTPSR